MQHPQSQETRPKQDEKHSVYVISATISRPSFARMCESFVLKLCLDCAMHFEEGVSVSKAIMLGCIRNMFFLRVSFRFIRE